MGPSAITSVTSNNCYHPLLGHKWPLNQPKDKGTSTSKRPCYHLGRVMWPPQDRQPYAHILPRVCRRIVVFPVKGRAFFNNHNGLSSYPEQQPRVSPHPQRVRSGARDPINDPVFSQ
uniref:Uncharacterized protein n=1 Tax=Knipowitschia caucasica TaxID=637954 RepID=A0AAV2JIR2_KNICA